MRSRPAARGWIVDTNSKPPAPKGRFDLIVYDDGLLAIHGNYLRTVIVGASAGAAASAPVIAAAGAGAGTELRGYDLKRFAATARQERDELRAGHPSNHFLPVSEIAALVLRRRWYEHSLQVGGPTSTRTYRWKPKLNRIDYVIELFTATFGVLFRVE